MIVLHLQQMTAYLLYLKHVALMALQDLKHLSHFIWSFWTGGAVPFTSVHSRVIVLTVLNSEHWTQERFYLLSHLFHLYKYIVIGYMASSNSVQQEGITEPDIASEASMDETVLLKHVQAANEGMKLLLNSKLKESEDLFKQSR